MNYLKIIYLFVYNNIFRVFAFKMNFLNRIDKDITLLLDNLPVGIVRFNNNKKCIYSNKFITRLFGIIDIEKLLDIYREHIHPDDLENEINVCEKFLIDQCESNSTLRIFNNELNDYRWMSNKRTFISSDKSFMFTLQDIHENKLLELKLRNESKRVEQAYNHKSIFLANVSHEVRTPINGIVGMLTLLEDTKLSNDQQDFISMIKECSYNLMTIINDILDYSKLEVGKISLDIKTMNLRECIETTNDIVLSKVIEKSLEYNYNIENNIPEFIYGDSNRIKQILLNLLSNSIKFTDKGSIFVNVYPLTFDQFVILNDHHFNNNIQDNVLENSIESDNICVNKIYLRFDITDTGCGIDTTDTDKLFKSFSQVDSQITSKIYQGTGLGLAICKELVELMGGFIWLESSSPSKGSVFSFVLPTIESIYPIIPDNLSENVLHGANVLIVDDNMHNRISLTGMITKWNMKPYAFSNSEEALHFTRLVKFDIGLIDICMPKIDGPTFASKLREQQEFNNKNFPLVALSSLGDKLSSSKFFKFSIIKPIKESKLKKICIDLLQKRPVQETTKNVEHYIIDNDVTELKNNIRILLAEDVFINQKVVVSFLKKLGYDNIQTVDNGQQCIDLATNNNFDIILLDIRMPIKNGEIVLHELNNFYSNNSQFKRPYMVAVTAYCLKEDKDKYLGMGFDDYIPKPITIDDLSKCLNKFIHKILYN